MRALCKAICQPFCTVLSTDDDRNRGFCNELDVYKNIEDMRLRKLLDNIMTKYQKSTNTTADDQSQYNYLIGQLSK